jgi:hypothetical protein
MSRLNITKDDRDFQQRNDREEKERGRLYVVTKKQLEEMEEEIPPFENKRQKPRNYRRHGKHTLYL